MIPCVTKEDLKEAAVIERRRRFENERKQRIFNARERIIGVDSDGLCRQVKEKREIQQQENEKQLKIFAEQRQHFEVACAKEKETQMENRRIHHEINDFRLTLQKPQDRRDFDLYDPNGKKNDLPARISDFDPRLTVSSAQIFDGEDLLSEQRKKAQIEQQRAWLEQQIRERKEAEEARLTAEKIQYDACVARERRAMDLERIERAGRNRILNSVTEFNRQLAFEQENFRKIKKQQEEADNLAEQYNHITSDILTESPDCEKSSFGPHRIVPYSYRRMTPEQVDTLRVEKIQQVEAQQQMRTNEQAINRQWDTMTNNFTRTMTLKEREATRLDREKFAQNSDTNIQMASEQNRAKEFIDKVIYTNEPTDAYFEQFNTMSR